MAFIINNVKTYNTLIYGLTRELLGLNSPLIEDTIKRADKYVSGGFVEREMGFYQPEKIEEKEIVFQDYQLKAFSEIVEKFEEKGIELILVYAPIPRPTYERYTNAKYFDSVMQGYATYYNFNEMISLNDSLHFYDSHHLNQNGVEIFNEKIIELIESR